MTITFFSNFMNIHQLPFCEELISHVGADNFRFVAKTKIDTDRIQMGFEDMNVTRPFVVRAYEGGEAYKKAEQLALESDVVIFGSASQDFQRIRLAVNKLSFRYNERIFKQGLIRWFDPRVQKLYRNIFTRYKSNELYVLCASAYTKPDLKLIGYPGEKCFKWGYFPEIKQYPNYEYLRGKKNGLKRPGVSILWAGRLIGLKHPEVAIKVAKHLMDKGIEFSLNILGDGPLRANLQNMINTLGLSDFVRMFGAQSHNVVLEEMEKADIFLFTSDRNEGWGAVLNEAMNAGCAVVADKHIGSAPFLIEHGKNGLFYSGTKADMCEKVDTLVSDSVLREEIGRSAWETINYRWDIKTATANLFTLIEDLNNHRESSVMDGPCSLA